MSFVQILIFSFCFLTPFSYAEDADPSQFRDPNLEDFLENPEVPFTGTLAEDDEENQEHLKKEEDLFGPEGLEEVEGEAAPSHQLHFEFVTRVKFINTEGQTDPEKYEGPPYMEIQYETSFEIPILLDQKKQRYELDAKYEADNWGSLAQNEFFDCRLGIDLQAFPVEITTRLKTQKKEEEEPTHELSLRIAFSKKLKENWFSFCTDVSGSKLNTEGDQEEYNLAALQQIEPDLNQLVFEEFDPTDTTNIPLIVDEKIVHDAPIQNNIVISGKGQITLSPI